MKTITIKDTNFVIKIPYDITLVNLIKISFSGRKWNPDFKTWQAPISEKNISAALQLATYQGFIISPATMIEIGIWKKKLNIQNEKANEMVEMSKAVDADIEIPIKSNDKLFPFQKAGVQFIEKTGGRVLIADEPGCGKTLQAIAWCQLHFEKRPILVICPKTLMINWKIEFTKWVGIKSYIIISKDNEYQLPTTTYEAYIINYDIVEKQKNLLKKIDPKIIILDESTAIKNPKAKRTKAINEIVKDCPHILALTGTPTLNSRPIEIYNTLKILSPQNFGNYWEFASRYCGLTRTRWGVNVSGATNIQELAEKLRSTVMIRRLKKDVLKELPDKMRIIVPQEINMKEYKRIEDDLINYLIEEKNKSKLQAEKINLVSQLSRIEYLKQETVKAKLPLFIEWVKTMDLSKLVIFCHHREFIDQLMIELSEFNPVKLMGGMSSEEKQKSIESFQNDKNYRLFIGSITSAGMGITLTAASHLAFLELMFVPALHDQAEDRILRIGQKNACSIYYFIGEGTIEQEIYDLLQSKRKIFRELMQDKNNVIENTDTNILNDLVNKLVNR